MRVFYLFLFLASGALISFSAYSQRSAASPASGEERPGTGLLPVPQQVSLTNQQYPLDDSWYINFGSNISKDDPAVQSLTSELKDRFRLAIGTKTAGRSSNSSNAINLTIKPGAVAIGKTTDTNRASLQKQAYRLKLDKGSIAITANGAPGLFYGVQTLIQLLQQNNGKTYFTSGEIVDWPDMDLRLIYWDDAHHLERLDAMKRAIRQASYYKINAFSLKLEGHFEFSAAKPIVEPYAYTPKEYQELTDYALAHYVQLVPFLDAPAHISFILKHPEYAALRAFPNSNYELSVTNPKADELMLGMFDNLIQANKGGKYVLFSTDEAYYVGKAESEKKRAQELGGNGRLLAEYITRVGNKLHEKGRKAIIWGEYPLTQDDITALPSHIINGVYNDEWAPKFKEHGMRQLIYTSAQGVEPLFPNYYKLPVKKSSHGSLALTDDEQQQGNLSNGRVGQVLETITSATAAGKADVMGVIVAAWGDAGLNPETFWLGYAAGIAPAWNVSSANAEDLTNRFYRSFYGNGAVHMDKVYQLLSNQAEFWDHSWEWAISKNRTPIFGNSNTIYDTPRLVKDQVLPLLPVPSATDLALNKDWNNDNQERLEAASKFLEQNNELMALLQENLVKANYQHYNLQVLRSVAQLCRWNEKMLLNLKRMNHFMNLSSKVATTNPAVAVSLLDGALDQAKRMRDERNEVLRAVTTVWYQDWYPRVAEANGRTYLDQVDDVKDHPPVRTVDMSYLIYRELNYPLGQWAEEVRAARNQFAQKNNLPLRTETLDWKTY